jgi:hypothetical protein
VSMQKLPINILELEKQVELREELVSKDELISLVGSLTSPRNLAETLLPMSTKPINYILSKNSAETSLLAGAAILLEPSEFKFVPNLKSKWRQPFIGVWPIIDEYEIWEARALELDAVILDSGLLEYSKLQWLIEVSRETGMESIVSVGQAHELALALQTDAKYLIIDVLKVDAAWAAKQLKRFGRGRQIILSLTDPTRLAIGNLCSLGYNCFHLSTTQPLSTDLVNELKVVTQRRSPLERSAPLQRFWR